MATTEIPSLVIVGVAGSGKSSIARHLTALTGITVNETDDLIAQIAGYDTATLVIHNGHSALQEHAIQASIQILSMPGIAVVSPTAACDELVISRIVALKLRGVPIVELFADLSTLIRRTGLNAPRAVGLGPTRKMLSDLVTRYRTVYATYADDSIDTSLAKPRHVAERLVAYLGQNTVS